MRSIPVGVVGEGSREVRGLRGWVQPCIMGITDALGQTQGQQWGLDGKIWPRGHMFDTPGVKAYLR